MHAHSVLDSSTSAFAADVYAGLMTKGRKSLPCRYLYDDVGSALFETICLLPEYGLSRADDRIIRAHASELAALCGRVSVVELGSGTGVKTRHILNALRRREPVTYYPIDVSSKALNACRLQLSDVADVRPLEMSYLEGLHAVSSRREPGRPLLVLFLGSTIGNFERADADQFLTALRAQLKPGDAVLLGTDLVKPEAQIIAAYDDAAGVTAAFSLNLLARINRELGGNFFLRNFRHEAIYDRREQRVEMHLRSRVAQDISIRDAGVLVGIEAGETIWIESSHKFSLEDVRSMAARSGFQCGEQWVDREWPFAESVLRPVVRHSPV
jgi:L-histidine N-alpha-methyltransferase